MSPSNGSWGCSVAAGVFTSGTGLGSVGTGLVVAVVAAVETLGFGFSGGLKLSVGRAFSDVDVGAASDTRSASRVALSRKDLGFSGGLGLHNTGGVAFGCVAVTETGIEAGASGSQIEASGSGVGACAKLGLGFSGGLGLSTTGGTGFDATVANAEDGTRVRVESEANVLSAEVEVVGSGFGLSSPGLGLS